MTRVEIVNRISEKIEAKFSPDLKVFQGMATGQEEAGAVYIDIASSEFADTVYITPINVFKVNILGILKPGSTSMDALEFLDSMDEVFQDGTGQNSISNLVTEKGPGVENTPIEVHLEFLIDGDPMTQKNMARI